MSACKKARLHRRLKPRISTSVRAILAHLAEDELVTSWRYRQMIEHCGATLLGFDQDEWARLGDYDAWTPRGALEMFRLLREANLRMLAGARHGLEHFGSLQRRGGSISLNTPENATSRPRRVKNKTSACRARPSCEQTAAGRAGVNSTHETCLSAGRELRRYCGPLERLGKTIETHRPGPVSSGNRRNRGWQITL